MEDSGIPIASALSLLLYASVIEMYEKKSWPYKVMKGKAFENSLSR